MCHPLLSRTTPSGGLLPLGGTALTFAQIMAQRKAMFETKDTVVLGPGLVAQQQAEGGREVVEKRIDPADMNAYTLAEFVSEYGGTLQAPPHLRQLFSAQRKLLPPQGEGVGLRRPPRRQIGIRRLHTPQLHAALLQLHVRHHG